MKHAKATLVAIVGIGLVLALIAGGIVLILIGLKVLVGV